MVALWSAPLAPPRAPVEGDSHASLVTLLEAVAGELGYQITYVEFGRLDGLCDYRTRRIWSPSGWHPTPACRCWCAS
jgi:hypothetical protein